ncbi:hypothetical protein N7452_011379 [Penicillium brevicompactum]|uniref:Uncharacterized protein n=1 Tax=Penicillium brevicompactum TaxID=5074 RepID=A0A9W9U6Y1_PENBR|nr:hypothetical protein N7452_011379 [Penicillium brevicompactum]
MTIYHNFVQQANSILEKEEAKADAVANVSSSSEESTLSMRPTEGEASTSSERGKSPLAQVKWDFVTKDDANRCLKRSPTTSIPR